MGTYIADSGWNRHELLARPYMGIYEDFLEYSASELSETQLTQSRGKVQLPAIEHRRRKSLQQNATRTIIISVTQGWHWWHLLAFDTLLDTIMADFVELLQSSP